MTQRTNDPNSPNCQVSLICFSLNDPDGSTSNYYSGMVDLPADTSGSWDNYSLDNSSPNFNDPITYDEETNTFTICYSILDTLYDVNGAYKTFMLPIYTDQGELSASIQMQVNVNINLVNSQGGITKTIVKQGTVSTIRTVHGNLGPADPASLELVQYITTGSPDNMNCWNVIIKSCTQPTQYFVILWTCIPQSVGAIWPLMYHPNASVGDIGSSTNNQVVCNWWNWNESPAVNRGIPAPDPIPNYTTIIGSIAATDLQYLYASLEGIPPGPDFGSYYQIALSM